MHKRNQSRSRKKDFAILKSREFSKLPRNLSALPIVFYTTRRIEYAIKWFYNELHRGRDLIIDEEWKGPIEKFNCGGQRWWSIRGDRKCNDWSRSRFHARPWCILRRCTMRVMHSPSLQQVRDQDHDTSCRVLFAGTRASVRNTCQASASSLGFLFTQRSYAWNIESWQRGLRRGQILRNRNILHIPKSTCSAMRFWESFNNMWIAQEAE